MAVSETQQSHTESLVWVDHSLGTSGRKMSEASVLSLRRKVYRKSHYFISLVRFHSIPFILVHFMLQPVVE